MYHRKQKLFFSAVGFMALLLAFAPICLAGGNAAPYLRDGVGARSLGLGGAFTAIADDATSTIWNPAGLPATEGLDFTLSRAAMAFDSTQNFMAIVKGLGENSSIGFSWMNVGTDDIMEVSADNDITGKRFSYDSNAMALSFGHALESFNLGASVRVLSDTVGLDAFDGVTSFGGVDIGMLARPGTSFSYGLSVRNLGGTVGEESVPILVDAGVAYHLLKGHRATFACDVEHEVGILDESPTRVRLGTEYRIARTLAVRGGTRVSKDRQTLFVGFGVDVGGLQLDYALKAADNAANRVRDAGETHFVSLSYGY